MGATLRKTYLEDGAVLMRGALNPEQLADCRAAFDFDLNNPGPGAHRLYKSDHKAGLSKLQSHVDNANPLAFQTLGPIVALGLVGSLAGSILPSILGDRVRPDVAISLAGVAMVLSYPSMMSHSIILLGGGFIMHTVAGTIGYTYYLGVVRRLDFTNRIYIAYPAFQAVGIAAATAFAGFVLANFTPAVLFGYAACLIITSGLALFAAEWLSARYARA